MVLLYVAVCSKNTMILTMDGMSVLKYWFNIVCIAL